MKNLLLILCFLSACLASPAQIPRYGDDTSDVYLQRLPIMNYTYITTDNQGERVLTTALCCGNFGPDNLRMVCDSPEVYVSGSNMHIEDYFEVELIDPWCPSRTFELGYKDEVFLESQGTQFPWCNQAGIAVMCAAQQEWDSITQYGTPPSSLAFAPYALHLEPSFDCATGVTKGRQDCYSYNPTFGLTGVPDGTWIVKISVNIPPNNPYDPGVYPNYYTHLGTFQGNSFNWTDVMPPAPIAPPNPTGIQASVASNRKTVNISWTGSSTSYEIQKYYDWGPNAGKKSGDPIPVNTTSYSYNPGKGQWYFGITAINCPYESTEIWSPSVHPTK
jgi:hypothetical protein